MEEHALMPAAAPRAQNGGASLWAFVRGRLVLWLLMAALLAMCWGGFASAHRLAALYPVYSLRYHTPIGHNAAMTARAHATNNPESSFWPTFFSEDEAEFSAELFTKKARCLWFSGEGRLVWPAEFEAGGYPAALDEGGCALSAGLCWQLWGSTDVVGNTLKVDGKELAVRGVFAGDAPLALVGTGQATFAPGWQAVQLSGTVPGSAAEAAQSFATLSGLGAPDTLLDGSSVSAVGWLLATLPACILFLAIGFFLLRWAMQKAGAKKELVVFGLLLLFALALPVLLTLLPAALVPGRWSDFDFWTRLYRQMEDALRSFFMMRALWPDAEAKLLLVKLAALFCGQMALLPCTGWLWLKKHRQPDRAPAASMALTAKAPRPSAGGSSWLFRPAERR